MLPGTQPRLGNRTEVLLNWLEKRRRRRLLERRPIGEARWRATVAKLPLLQRLDPERQARLRAHATWFLNDKDIYGAAGLELDESMRLSIAAQACLPVLELGYEWLYGWYSIYVYPGEFRTRRSHYNRDGLVEQDHRVLAGEAQHQGGLVLSWADIEEDAVFGEEGQNVVIHEIAHKLDMRNGEADGYPPLRPGMDPRAWERAMRAAFEDLRDQDRRGVASIDPYAASEPAEFFAVTSEYYFAAPALLKAAYPAVYRQLDEFYLGGSGG